MSRIIVVANQKAAWARPPCGNLAASLAVMEKKVLVVDCDPQANASSGLGIYPDVISDNIYTVLHEPERVRKDIIKTPCPTFPSFPRPRTWWPRTWTGDKPSGSSSCGRCSSSQGGL